MKPKTMILMLVAVGCGLAASYMTSRLLAERGNKESDEAKVTVVVATKRVPAFTSIKDPEKYFVLKEVAENAAPKKAFKAIEEIKDQRLNRPMAEDEYLTADHVLNKDAAGLQAELPPGTRAVAIKVNAESLVGGFVLPRSRVDVLFTMRGNSSEARSKVILQDMLVLAVDTTSNRDTQTQTLLGNTVTLAVKPEEATRLALAQSLGELRLTLRGLGDNERVHLTDSKVADLDRQQRSNDGSESGEAVAKADPPPVPALPTLPTPPPETKVKEEPKKEEPKEEPKKEEPKEDPLEKHTMVLINGESQTKAVFVRRPGEEWKYGTVNKDEEGAPPRSERRGRN